MNVIARALEKRFKIALDYRLNAWPLPFCAFVLCLMHIVLFMRGYRLSADDAGFTQAFTEGYLEIWKAAATDAHVNGRIGMYLMRPINIVGAYWSGYVPARFAFVSLYFTNFLLFSIHVGRMLKADVSLLLFVILVAMHPLAFEHMPPTAYPLQNSLPICLILIARILLQQYPGQRPTISRIVASVFLYALLALAMSVSEYALIFGTSLLIAEYGVKIMRWKSDGVSVRSLLNGWRFRMDVFVAVFVLLIYIVFRWFNPSQYNGNSPDSIDQVGKMAFTAVGHVASGTIFLRLDSNIASLPIPVLVVSLICGLLTFLCIVRLVHKVTAIRQPFVLAVGALLLALYIVTPLATTRKQQAWCMDVQSCGFLDSRISYLWCCVFFLCAATWLWRILVAKIPANILAKTFALGFGVLASLTYSYNWRQARQMASVSQAWKRAEALACHVTEIPETDKKLDEMIDPRRAVQFHPEVARGAYWRKYVTWGSENFSCPVSSRDRKLNYDHVIGELKTGRVNQLLSGEIIRFSDDKNSELLGDNWSTSESWGVWSIGTISTMKVFIPAGKDMRLGLRAIRHDPRGISKPVAIRVNGELVGNIRLTSKPKTYKIDIPAEVIGKDVGGVTTIEFLVPDAASPLQDGSGSDTRVLGVGLIEMSLMPSS